MADWTDIPDGAVAAGGLPSGETVTALRDNAPAAVEGKAGVLHAATTNLVEVAEPTSDVSAITFSYDISGMRGIRVEYLIELTAAATLDLQVRASAGTWRTLASSQNTISSGQAVIGTFDLFNVNNADGTGVVRAASLSSRMASGIDRSNAAVSEGSPNGTPGYSSHSETLAQVRLVASTGNIEGSSADARSMANLFVIPEPTREASL